MLLRLLVVTVVICAFTAAAASADAPANDAFAAAQPLTVGESFSGTTAEATGELGEPAIEGEAYGSGCTTTTGACQRSVWYSITPTVDGPLTLSVCGAVSEAFTGAALSGLGGVAATRSSTCPDMTASGFDAYAGVTYLVGIAGVNGTGGPFSGSISATPQTSFPSIAGDPTRNPIVMTLYSPNAGATFECDVDGGAFSACSSPASFPGLPDGPHQIGIRAVVGGVADPTPIVASITVDDTPPTAMLTANPADGGSTAGTASFTVSSNESGYVYCAVDSEPIGICTFAGSPWTVALTCNGSHTFTAMVVDQAGNMSGQLVSHWTTVGHADGCVAPTISSVTATPGWKSAELGATIGGPEHGTDTHLVITGGPVGAQSFDSTVLSHHAAFDPSGLVPGTTYGYTITATDPEGPATPQSGSFTTASVPPGSASESVTDITDHEATLSGSYDPGTYGSWAFLLGPSAAYGRLEPVGFAFPMSNGPRSFSYRVGGLAAGSSVHYTLQTQRTDADNSLVAVTLPDASFTTSGTPAVVTPPATPPPATTPTTAPPPAVGAGPPAVSPVGLGSPVGAKVSTTKRPVVTGRGTKLTLDTGVQVTCTPGIVSCRVTAEAETIVSAKGVRAAAKRKPVVLGRAKATIAAGHHATVKIKLTTAGARALRNARKLRASLIISITGPTSKPLVISKTLTVRAT